MRDLGLLAEGARVGRFFACGHAGQVDSKHGRGADVRGREAGGRAHHWHCLQKVTGS